MPDKKYGDVGPNTPRRLTDEDVEARLAGLPATSIKGFAGLEEHQRPLQFNEEEVEARLGGKEIDLVSEDALASVGDAEIEQPVRPIKLSEKDVEARLAGKEVKFADRARLEAHEDAARIR